MSEEKFCVTCKFWSKFKPYVEGGVEYAVWNGGECGGEKLATFNGGTIERHTRPDFSCIAWQPKSKPLLKGKGIHSCSSS